MRIVHQRQVFESLAKVAYARRSAGVGLVFTAVGERAQQIMEVWISELRENRSREMVGVRA